MYSVPYIGITDFLNYAQVVQMEAVFKASLNPKQNRRLHIGVMMSYKTLNGIETKWSKAFPPKEDISDIFGSTYTMNCLHYADYDAVNVTENLVRAVGYGGPGMNALQLDMLWPDPTSIAIAVGAASQPIEVIVQVGRQAIESSNNNPAEVVRRLESYVGVAHHVLIDKSMGKGLGMDAEALLPYAQAINGAFPQFGLVAAGGLGPTSIDLVQPLAAKFPNISIDAQGKLRPSGSAHDPIDWDMAGMYLRQALALLH